MAENSGIKWTDNTFNPWMGCTKVSPGCTHCYAETFARNRMGKPGLWGANGQRQVTSDENWRKPLRWDRLAGQQGVRTRVFCASLCDVFEDHPVAEGTRPRLWDLIRRTLNLDWQLLTKRADRIATCLPADWGDGWPNVWLGVSVENREHGIPRIAHLRAIPARVRFLSVEPLLEDLGPVDLAGIDWVIVGGESGPKRRPMDHQWARHLRDQCRTAGVAFFFKQSSAFKPGQGDRLDGRVIREFPVLA
jgi:protein gp37